MPNAHLSGCGEWEEVSISRESGHSAESILAREGLTFHRRLALADGAGSPDPSRATELWGLWEGALGGARIAGLSRRLEWDGLTWDEASRRLLTPSQVPSPYWWEGYSRIQAWLREGTPIGAPQDRGDEGTEPEDSPPFADLWWVVARAAVAELQGSLDSLLEDGEAARLFGPQVYRDVARSLVRRLADVAQPLLWEEFSRRRTPMQVMLAHLGAGGDGSGPPTREAYVAFLEEVRKDGLEALSRAHPVFPRHLATVVRFWLESTREMLERVQRDHARLRGAFDLPDDAVLAGVRQGMGDPHHGGRTVATLVFSSARHGDRTWQVVYKPRDMTLDGAYQRALEQAPVPPGDSPLRTLALVAGQGYGYVEFLPHRVCHGPEDLGRFYRNAGRLVAVLHLLGCTDCHHSNLVADGTDLVLIDTETLFEGVVANHVLAETPSVPAPTALERSVANSILRSGLLPHWMFVEKGRVAVDMSALGSEPPMHAQYLAPGWMAVNSDGMVPARVPRPARGATSLPVGVGTPNPLADFADEICGGFRDQISSFRDERARWMDPGGVLDTFRGLSRRIVIRATRVYAAIADQMLQPSALRGAVAQGLVLEKLARSYLLADSRPRHWPVFAAEVAQLEQLDVPFFAHPVDNRELPLPGGDCVAEFLEVDGLQRARDEFRALDEDSIAFQERMMRGVLAARGVRASRPTAAPPGEGRAPSPPLSREQRREEVGRIAEQLLGDSIMTVDGRREWLGTRVGADADKLCYGALGPSVYDGLPGIALFLRAAAPHLGATAGQVCDAARSAMAPLLHRLVHAGDPGLFRWWRDAPLGLSGWGGFLLAASQWALLDPGCRYLLEGAMPAIVGALSEDRLRSDVVLDVMGGVAGLVGPLLAVGGERAMSLARVAGAHLLERQHANGGWQGSSAVAPRPLAGFSHGAAGIAASLMRLHAACPDAALLEGARRALAYERSIFDAEQRNWPDLRRGSTSGGFMVSWCHGAPGIGLSRLCLLDTPLWGPEAREELSTALETTWRQPNGADGLCCGRFGRVAILRLAAERLQEESWQAAADAMEAEGVAAASAAGGRYRHSFTLEGEVRSPGLFTGTAGIGLVLLQTPESQGVLRCMLSAGLLGPA